MPGTRDLLSVRLKQKLSAVADLLKDTFYARCANAVRSVRGVEKQLLKQIDVERHISTIFNLHRPVFTARAHFFKGITKYKNSVGLGKFIPLKPIPFYTFLYLFSVGPAPNYPPPPLQSQ